jgi:hypothetical protein
MATNGLAVDDGDAKAQVNRIMKQDRDKGVAVYSFDPDASPSEKGAAAGKGHDLLKGLNVPAGAGERGRWSW